MILQAQGKTGAARERFERVMRFDASAPVAANNLAWIYAQSGGSLDRALELALTAQRGLPKTPEVNDTLGVIYHKKGMIPQAVEVLKLAVEADDTNADFHYHLGRALADAGEKRPAVEHLTRALTLKPDFDDSANATEQLRLLRAP
jgi:Flp pilus assembly protein TadD